MEVTIRMDASGLVKEIMPSVVGLVLGWLASSFYRVGKKDFDDFKKERVDAQSTLREEMLMHFSKVETELKQIEDGLSQRVTRAELKETLDSMKADMKDWINDLKLEIRSVKLR